LDGKRKKRQENISKTNQKKEKEILKNVRDQVSKRGRATEMEDVGEGGWG
jgi:hypothetical protein